MATENLKIISPRLIIYEFVTANDPTGHFQAYIDVERVRRILNKE